MALLGGLDDLACRHVSLGWLRCIPLQLVLAAVAVEMSVAQMLKLHLSFVKVAVAAHVAAGADDHIRLALKVTEKLYSLISKCLKVFLPPPLTR